MKDGGQLTEGDRAQVVLDMEELRAELEREARERQLEGLDKARAKRYGANPGLASSDANLEPPTPNRTRDQLAKLAGVGACTITRQAFINEHAPDLVPKVRMHPQEVVKTSPPGAINSSGLSPPVSDTGGFFVGAPGGILWRAVGSGRATGGYRR